MPAGRIDPLAPEQEKAARCGEPSYVWRAGQQRRLDMVLDLAGERCRGSVLENGCGVGIYADRLASFAERLVGLEYDFDRAAQASQLTMRHPGCLILCAAGESLPLPDGVFDLVLSHEVLEHVQDDRLTVLEMMRTLRPRGRLMLFVPNRGYPFETHGIYWRGKYHFGNIPLINYLPGRVRDRLAPHVRVYTGRDLQALFCELPVRIVYRTAIFGAYDNIIARWPRTGRLLRAILQFLEKTPLRFFGLSHFWVVEKAPNP